MFSFLNYLQVTVFDMLLAAERNFCVGIVMVNIE